MAASQAVRSSVICPVRLSYFLQVSQLFSHELTSSKRITVKNMTDHISFMPLLTLRILCGIEHKVTKKIH